MAALQMLAVQMPVVTHVNKGLRMEQFKAVISANGLSPAMFPSAPDCLKKGGWNCHPQSLVASVGTLHSQLQSDTVTRTNIPSRPETLTPNKLSTLLVDILIEYLLYEDFSSENSWVWGESRLPPVL